MYFYIFSSWEIRNLLLRIIIIATNNNTYDKAFKRLVIKLNIYIIGDDVTNEVKTSISRERI